MNKVLLVYEDYADLMMVESTLKKVGFDVMGLSNEYSVTEQILAFNPDIVVGSGRGGRVSALGVGKRLKEMNRWAGKVILIFPSNLKPHVQEFARIRVDMIVEAPVSNSRLAQVIGSMLGQDEAVLIEKLNKALSPDSAQKNAASSRGNGKFPPENEAIYVKSNVQPPENIESAGEAVAPVREGDGVKKQITVVTDNNAKVTGVKAEVNAPPAQSKTQQDVLKAEASLKARIEKYSTMVADKNITAEKNVNRADLRSRLKDLSEDKKPELSEDLDKKRKQFTNALFKK